MKDILFFDIDGTLSTFEKGLVPSAKEAIEKCRATGRKCIIATGRHLNALSVLKDLETDGIIFCNGGGIQIDGKIVELAPIPKDLCDDTVFKAEERYGYYSLLGEYKAFKNPPEMMRMEDFLEMDHRYSTLEEKLTAYGAYPFEEYRGEEILKIDIGFDEESTMTEFLKVMDDRLEIVMMAGFNAQYGNRSGEITAKGVDKGAAVRRVVELLGGDMEHTYGFGDSGNDIGMLKTCHTGVAMGNATDVVKEAADYTAPAADDDGIYKALEHFGLLD